MLARRRAMTPAERVRESGEICAHVQGHASWAAARTLCAYLPLPDEVDVLPLVVAGLARRLTVLVPRVVGAELVWHRISSLAPEAFVQGRFGLREPREDCAPVCAPQAAPQPVLWLVPGVAFDRRGGRLGRGGGYYDRALRTARATTGTVGIAFTCQLVDAVPMAPQDWKLASVVSPAGWHTAV